MEEEERKDDEQLEKEKEEEESFEDNDLFVHNMNSTLYVKKDYDSREYNYEWLDILEDCVPYIENILRNPKRFIINEEEIVKVELSRKVTVESVIHLTQHTNLIQKVDEDGEVKPSKILNINKEESLDTYENRFIFTLVNNLRMFFEQRLAATTGAGYCFDKNNLQYEANTKVNGETLKISLQLDDVTHMIQEHAGSKGGFSFEERIRNLKMQIDSFFGYELMVILAKLHVPPVRSPIRKTNVILKNPNFRKAEELWNYIQSFESKDKRRKEKKEFFDCGALKDEYDQAFLMTFIANKNLISRAHGVTESSVIQQMSQRLIDNLMETDPDLTEDRLAEIFHQQILTVKEKNEYKKERIHRILDDRFKREKEVLNELIQSFKEEINEEDI